MGHLTLVGLLLVSALSAAAVAGCGSWGELKLCGQIPSEGCPIGRGGTCRDMVCAALYDCVDGAWTEVERCSGAGGGGGGGGGGGACEMVTIDKTGEATGCEPDLQSPDCPASAAEVCVESACLTDCTDFFLCTKDGWVDVAYCDAAGQLVMIVDGAPSK